MNAVPGKEIDHPGVWRGKELLNSKMWNDTRFQFPLARNVDSGFANEIRDELENGSGVVLIKGPNPESQSIEECKRDFLEFCSVIGTPISQSAKGEKVFSVRDERYGKDDPRTRGPNTRNKLSFHTDRCDVIAFLCLKQAKVGGENQLVSSMAIYNEMLHRRPDLVQVLSEPFFYQRHNVDLGNEMSYTQQPIFSFFRNHFASNFLRVLIDRAYASNDVPPLSSLQLEALDYLESLADDAGLHITFRQQEGDFLLLNNWVTYHRRTEFEDFEDIAQRRHLLRVWLSMPNSRPIDPMFAGNYGATEAGAIRGGMHAASKR